MIHNRTKRCLARARALRGRAALATGDEATAKASFTSASTNYDAAVAAAPNNKNLRDEAAAIERLLAE